MPVGRGSAALEIDPVGAVGEMLQILEDFRITCKLAIGPDLESEELGRRLNRLSEGT